MAEKYMLLLNASPRKKGTSFSFARTLNLLAEKFGCKAEMLHIIDYFDGRESFDYLKEMIIKSSIIGLISPVYVDTLPYPAIWFLEKLSGELRDELCGKSFFAVAQSGFPEIAVCRHLLEVCDHFAESTGMNWLGGLAYGGGAIINGALMEDLGKKGQNITAGFTLALDSILQGKKVPCEAQKLLILKIPKILYHPLAAFLNHSARKDARAQGVDLARKAYLE